jgi:hypothetical protein
MHCPILPLSRVWGPIESLRSPLGIWDFSPTLMGFHRDAEVMKFRREGIDRLAEQPT